MKSPFMMVCPRWMFLLAFLFLPRSPASADSDFYSNAGKEFVIGFMENFESEKPLPLEVYITTTSVGTVTVNLTVPLMQEAFDNITFVIKAGTGKFLKLPHTLRMTPGTRIQDKGIHITASDDVSVIGINKEEWTADSYLALPVSVLGKEYMAMSIREDTHALSPSELAVIATSDDTFVNITIPKLHGDHHKIYFQGLVYTQGESMYVTLHKFQIFQLQSKFDVTGISVICSNPVAMLSGAYMAAIGEKSHDHLVEMLPSLNDWGTHFVTAPLAESKAGDVIKLLAQEGDTKVTIVSTKHDEITQIHLRSGGESAKLDRGEDEYWTITSSKPILVAIFSKSHNVPLDIRGDPAMILISPVELYLSSYSVISMTNSLGKPYTNYVNIICPTPFKSSMLFDDKPIPKFVDNDWFEVQQNTFSALTIQISGHGVHEISNPNTTFGAWFYGVSAYETTGNMLGMRFHRPKYEEIDIFGSGDVPENFTDLREIEIPSLPPFAVKVVSITLSVLVLLAVIIFKVVFCFRTMRESIL